MKTSITSLISEYERKDLLRFITAGSVDDGKSTLIGRLLVDSKLVFEDHLASLVKDSKRIGSAGGEVDYALLCDGLRAEREQGITIDVAYRYFATPRRKFIIADAPGHEQYTRNMATGASNVQLAVILLDARKGVLPQTVRHSFIASLLGVRHFVVAVNKMDLVDYDRDVFESIRDDYTAMSAKLEIGDVRFFPISALKGDNVVEPSENMPWYRGGPLLDYLETVHVASDRNLIDFRFPVQYVLRPSPDFRGYAGTIASGIVRPGDEITVYPGWRESKVKSVVTYDGDLEEAFAPQAVTLTLEDELDVSRGDLILKRKNVPRTSDTLDAMIVWMSEDRLEPGKPYWIKHANRVVNGKFADIHYKVNVNNLRREPASAFHLNEIGRATLELGAALAWDPYGRNRTLGSFIVIDRLSNNTVGAGMIVERRAPRRGEKRLRFEAGAVKERLVKVEDRKARYGHGPATVWITGLPMSGKTTTAFALEKRLFEKGCVVSVLDSESVRLGVNSDLGFSAGDRAENIRRASEIAALANRGGQIAVIALLSPRGEDRARAREVLGSNPFLEVYLHAPMKALRERDEKGIYTRAESGEVLNFPGVSADYEPPESPDLAFDTSTSATADIVDEIVAHLEQRGVLPEI